MSVDPSQEYGLALATGDANYIATAAKGLASEAEANVQEAGDNDWSPTDPNSPSNVQSAADRAAAARDKAAQDAENAREAARTKYEQDQTIAQVKAIFNTYGLQSLYSKIEEYVRKGYTGDTVALVLRETPEYKQRFPAMASLSAKNRAISEGTYIEYETTASGLERRYGLPKGMLMDNVTKLLENEVSPAELNDRVTLASAAAIQAPKEIRDTLSSYYNIGDGGLTAYFLDPAVATPLLEKQYATAQIGAEAMRQDVSIDVNIAQNLQELGVSQDAARQGFGQVAQQKAFTQGRGDVVSQQDLIAGNLTGNAQAQKDIRRVSSSRVGRFQGGGEVLQDKGGASGLGSAAT